jgi:hypothetical protein
MSSQEAGKYASAGQAEGSPGPQREPHHDEMALELQPAAAAGGWQRLSQSPKAGRIAAIVGGLLLLGAIGGGLAISGLPWGGGTNPPPGPTTNVSASPILPVPPAEIGRAVMLLAMADAEKAKVQEAVKNNKMRIGYLTVMDSDAEDGDWISVSSAGLRQDIRLFKAPLVVAVPYFPGEMVRITGLVDGDGGGITLAAQVGLNIIALRPLRVGESIEVPTP